MENVDRWQDREYEIDEYTYMKKFIFEALEKGEIGNIASCLIDKYPISFLWFDNDDEEKSKSNKVKICGLYNTLSRFSNKELKTLNDEFEKFLKDKIYNMLFGSEDNINRVQERYFDRFDLSYYLQYYKLITDFAAFAGNNAIYLQSKEKKYKYIISIQRWISHSDEDVESIDIPFEKNHKGYKVNSDGVRFVNKQPVNIQLMFGKEKYINLIIRKIEFIQRINDIIKKLSSQRDGSKHLGIFGKK